MTGQSRIPSCACFPGTFSAGCVAAQAPPPDGLCYQSGQYVQPGDLHKWQETIGQDRDVSHHAPVFRAVLRPAVWRRRRRRYKAPLLGLFHITPANPYDCILPFDTAVAAAPAPPPDGTCHCQDRTFSRTDCINGRRLYNSTGTYPIICRFSGQFIGRLCGGAGAAATVKPDNMIQSCVFPPVRCMRLSWKSFRAAAARISRSACFISRLQTRTAVSFRLVPL